MISFNQIIKEVKLKINLILGFCEFCYTYNLTITRIESLVVLLFSIQIFVPLVLVVPQGTPRPSRICHPPASPAPPSEGVPEAS